MLYQFRKATGVDLESGPGVLALLDATDSAFLIVRGESAATVAEGANAPVDVWARTLRRLRQGMVEMLGDVTHALDTVVVACPVHFSAEQEETVRQAGKQAGVEVVELLPAPVAAAVYYSWMNDRAEATYLVCQVGEGSGTASVVRQSGAEFAVLATALANLPAEGETDRPLAAGALAGCREALARAQQAAGVNLSQVDYVLLAGAAPHVAAIQEALTQALVAPATDRPQVLAQEPEVCVACGAALRGAARGRTYRFGGRPAGDSGRQGPPQLELHLAGPARTRDTACTLSGTAHARPPLDLDLGASVRVEMLASGVVEEAFLDADGRFAQGLKLAPDVDNPLSLTVCDVAGRELAVVPCPVRHATRPEPGARPARLLPRALQLELLDSQRRRVRLTVAPARAVVPAEFPCLCRTADQSGKIVVPVWEEDRQLQTVTLTGLPPDLPAGSPVEVRLRIEGPARVEVIVNVRDAGRSETVVIEAGPRPAPVAADAPLAPEWPAFARLVKHCLILAGDVANQTGRDRAEFFEQVYAQERYGEQAYQEKNQARYQECVENLGHFLYYLEQLARQSPGYSRPGADLNEILGKSKSSRDTTGMLEVRERAC